MPARVLIVEDHAILASTLGSALAREGFEVRSVRDPSDDEIATAVVEFAPDAVLLDLDLGEGRTSLSQISGMRSRGAEVVVLTGTADNRLHAEALERGASGIVSKAAPFENLVDALRIALDHKPVTSVTARETLLDQLRQTRAAEKKAEERFSRLTQSEREVLTALLDGKSAEAIAKERVVSLATVRTHIRSILLKLEVHSQIAAIALAREAGWPRN